VKRKKTNNKVEIKMVDFFLTIHWLSLSVLLSAAGQQLRISIYSLGVE
jgi:hypothetical protein